MTFSSPYFRQASPDAGIVLTVIASGQEMLSFCRRTPSPLAYRQMPSCDLPDDPLAALLLQFHGTEQAFSEVKNTGTSFEQQLFTSAHHFS